MKIKHLSKILPWLLVFGFYISDVLPALYPDSSNRITSFIKGIACGLTVVWLVWRGWIKKTGISKTGLETGLVAFGIAFLVSLIFTPEIRQAWPVLASMIRFVLIFYLLLDVLGTFTDHSACLSAMLGLSGFLLFLALLETYSAYLGWWNAAGVGILPPYPYRFRSLLLYSNSMMVYANLLAPLAVISFIKAKKRIQRVSSAGWIILFVLCLPFSSSRGGWLGTATWVSLMIIYFVVQKGWLKRLLHLERRWKIAAGAGLIVVLVVAALAGIYFLQAFASHPSHGGNPFGGRAGIWQAALAVFTHHPIWGAGPGMPGLELFATAESIPPRFWSLHAYSMYFQVLAEFGLVGFAGFAILLGLLIFGLWKIFRQAPADLRLFVFAVMAGLASFLVHNLVDDFTMWTSVMDQLLILLVWVFTLQSPLPQVPRVKLNVLLIPLVLVTGWFLWDSWSVEPMRQATTAAGNGDWAEAVQQTGRAVERDGALRYNRDMHAMTLAWYSAQTGDENALSEAVNELDYVLDTTSSPALWAANLAVMEWQLGEKDVALADLHQAIERAPEESTFYLNLAVMQENIGDPQSAIEAYCKVLELKPQWADHPFWNATVVRQDAKNSCDFPADESLPWWRLSQQAIQQGDLETARLDLARSNWADEPDLARGVTRGMLLEAEGQYESACSAWEDALAYANTPDLASGGLFAAMYASYFARSAMPFDLVPGYIQLQQDMGQFTVIDKLIDAYRENGNSEKLEWAEGLKEMMIEGRVCFESTL